MAGPDFNISFGLKTGKHGIDPDHVQPGEKTVIPGGHDGVGLRFGVPDRPDLFFQREGFSKQFLIVVPVGIDYFRQSGMWRQSMAVSRFLLNPVFQEDVLIPGTQESVELFKHGS